ncbi:hypothetical protein [Streptomyces coeruleorubidus]|uniref:Uncharacterized protein n=1 Tax=Streptomyces coeruleorubidus TaxID=116188 RepID=A0ABZ0K4Y1_STRC4|nr:MULTISPECIES: hypothetical protein [Streptomyces]WOT32744.1 hypothetical protein R5U08_00665 [Streptomyces coeruleorubidus]GGU29174.1 hypothetical protein GCM10010244_64600 [Streptomyces bellus]
MRGAMSWLSGHDRQRLDHLAEANYEARAREAAAARARAWATRARQAETVLERLGDWCDRLDEIARAQGGPDASTLWPPTSATRSPGTTGEGQK